MPKFDIRNLFMDNDCAHSVELIESVDRRLRIELRISSEMELWRFEKDPTLFPKSSSERENDDSEGRYCEPSLLL